VASLLEVGTGFHPELTGRENVFLNGAILGMTRAEVRQRFDEIIDFSGVEKFLDTPVKRYSVGMYARLAFAVAAHLESEVLVIDEVLAVGDAEFQARCLDRMSAVANAGRTVLFVSHNLAAVTALTRRAIVFQSGRVYFDGAIDEAVAHYAMSLRKIKRDRNWGKGNSTRAACRPIATSPARRSGCASSWRHRGCAACRSSWCCAMSTTCRSASIRPACSTRCRCPASPASTNAAWCWSPTGWRQVNIAST
jgi:ABC-type multidrug transport system ATPase subunit